MRPIERIDNFLNKVNFEELSSRWNTDLHAISKAQEYNTEIYIEILKYWKENSDQRFGQVLINLGLISDNLGIWVDEERDILLDQGIPTRECTYWTSVYDSYENVLPEPRHTLIKDLTTDHLYAIKSFCEKRLLPKPQVILDEIDYRKQKKGTD